NSANEYNKTFGQPKATPQASPPRQYLPETVPQFAPATPQKQRGNKFFRPYNKKNNVAPMSNPYAGGGTIDPPLPGSEAARNPITPPPPAPAPQTAPAVPTSTTGVVSPYQPTQMAPAPAAKPEKKKFFRPYRKTSAPEPSLFPPQAPPAPSQPTVTQPAAPTYSPAPAPAAPTSTIFRDPTTNSVQYQPAGEGTIFKPGTIVPQTTAPSPPAQSSSNQPFSVYGAVKKVVN
ncbi:MAG: hypothetical protein AAF226_15630, partial [Verrucomicrobiota bacterium]